MIRTRDLFVPNEALYQAEPHSDNDWVTVLMNNNTNLNECLQKNDISGKNYLQLLVNVVFFEEAEAGKINKKQSERKRRTYGKRRHYCL